MKIQISVALAIALIYCPAAPAEMPPGARQVKHIVFILKENHTFDNYVGAFPGAEGAFTGKIHAGETISLGNAPDEVPVDISHSSRSALRAMDRGKMYRFDLIGGAFQEGRLMNYTQYSENQIPNYWALASNFVLADEFFTSVHGPSFPNHLFTVAAQSGGAVENPSQLGAWGCDAMGETAPIINSDDKRKWGSPCFDFPTLADSLAAAGSARGITAHPKGRWATYVAL